jgi:hypothetical protein
MRVRWAPSPRGRIAAFHALKFLSSVLMPETCDDNGGVAPAQPPPPGFELAGIPYSARRDMLLNRPWVLYFAALVLWSYGHALEGPCPDVPAPSAAMTQTLVADMRAYLSTYATVRSPDELAVRRGVNANSAVLLVLAEAFKQTRWELLHEAANLLGNCIMLNSGGTVS